MVRRGAARLGGGGGGGGGCSEVHAGRSEEVREEEVVEVETLLPRRGVWPGGWRVFWRPFHQVMALVLEY